MFSTEKHALSIATFLQRHMIRCVEGVNRFAVFKQYSRLSTLIFGEKLVKSLSSDPLMSFLILHCFEVLIGLGCVRMGTLPEPSIASLVALLIILPCKSNVHSWWSEPSCALVPSDVPLAERKLPVKQSFIWCHFDTEIYLDTNRSALIGTIGE